RRGPECRRNDHVHIYNNLTVISGKRCARSMGGCDLALVGAGERTVRYHPSFLWTLTYRRYPAEGHYQASRLTGAVASQRVTEALEGWLRLFGNQPQSVNA